MRAVITLPLAFVLALAGCSRTTSTSPSTNSPITSGFSAGVWTSALTNRAASTCTEFRWTIAEVTPTRASGTFTAVCNSATTVSGSAQGTLSGSTITWTATATAALPNQPACAIALTGTIDFQGTTVRVIYSGTTCLGPVSGTEFLVKQ